MLVTGGITPLRDGWIMKLPLNATLFSMLFLMALCVSIGPAAAGTWALTAFSAKRIDLGANRSPSPTLIGHKENTKRIEKSLERREFRRQHRKFHKRYDRERAKAGKNRAERRRLRHEHRRFHKRHERRRAKRREPKFRERQYRRHHRQFHRRYRPEQPGYRQGHRRFHRHYRKRHRRPRIYLEFGPRYYDPWYYDPRYYDPYYYTPRYRQRISCTQARLLVRNYGYRRVRAYDCRGKVYGFIAWRKNKRYKVRVSARTGSITSRRRF